MLSLGFNLSSLFTMKKLSPFILLGALLSLTHLSAAKSTDLTSALHQQDALSEQQIDSYQTAGRWLGPGWWGNRLHDWSIKDSQFVCAPNRGFLAWRVAHDTTRNLDSTEGNMALTLDVSMTPMKANGAPLAPNAISGVLLGSGHSIADPMARLLMFDYGMKKKQALPSVPGSGYAVGFSGDGSLTILDLDLGKTLSTKKLAKFGTSNTLQLTTKAEGEQIVLTARSGKTEISTKIPKARFSGGLGLISHPGTKGKGVNSLITKFSNYSVKGGHQQIAAQVVGPVVSAQYTTNRGVLKLAAQCMPLPKGTELELSYRQNGQKWVSGGKQVIHDIDQKALFRVKNWDSSKAADYRVSVNLPGLGDSHYSGIIAAEPKKETLRLAALGCIIHRPWGSVWNWNQVLYFPHHDLQQRVAEQKPDIVFFYGDQMYENTPSNVDRANIHEDYLYKWLFHCLAFKETIRNVPSITIPDDHDVYQGNYWGEGGRKAPDGNWNNGGYKYPAAFVSQVHRTHTSHLPDAYEPNCLKQNIPAYHCDWLYGGMSFAILGDRYFKSGPAGHGLPESGTKRPDHYNNPDFDTADLDLPGLQLLGEPQERFLAEWATDWSGGAQMKAVLSQSPFGNLATHHHGTYLIADLDGNGWPQSGRSRALSIMRSARAVHIAGDQHLSTMVQHGLEKHDDAIFSFTAPAVANAYARAYHPTYKGNYYKATPPTPDQYLGKRKDGFKNLVTFHAVANPDTRTDGPYHTKERPQLNHQVPGFGIVEFNLKQRTSTFMSLPRSAEVASRLENGNYPGWPVTVKQDQNDGREVTGELIRYTGDSSKNSQPVVSVYNPDGTLQWSKRMTTTSFTIHAYAKGEHTIVIDGEKLTASPAKKGQVVTSK